MGYTSDSEQCSNRLELDLISLLVNFPCELGQTMIMSCVMIFMHWMIVKCIVRLGVTLAGCLTGVAA